MASTVRDEHDEKPMVTDAVASAAEEPDDDEHRPSRQRQPQQPRPNRVGGRGGFFTIYKKGQGYWTRMGTAIGAALIILLAVGFLYQQLPIWLRPLFTPPDTLPAAERSAALAQSETTVRTITLSVVGAVLLGFAALSWWAMNRPNSVDFLIATDSEMKKVNWTSRRELLGSTKVVIAFMFLTAAFLFAMDVLFGYVFYFLKVLKAPPF